MRWSCLVLGLAGCGFHSSAGAPDAALPIPDGGVQAMQHLGASELEAGQLVDMTFDAVRGSLTPSAYTYGGLIAHGLAGMHLWDHAHTTWMSPASAGATGAGLWRGDSFTETGNLAYLGVSADQTMTVWFEGEVWLDASSTETFGLVADDVAFIDLARPGTPSFTRVIENDPANRTAPVATPDTGWYPIRIGFANGDGTLGFAFTHSDGAGAQVAWTRDRLRARGSELSGALRTVFAHQILGGGDVGKLPISHVDDGSLLVQTGFPAPPQGASTDNSNWSARYAAQIYVAQIGSYTLKVTSDDGHELWFGGQTRSPNWAFNSSNGGTSSTVPAMLNAGWNDVIVDYNQVGGNRNLQVQLVSGGQSADIPHAQLRPVEPALDRLALGSDDTAHNVPDGGGQNQPGTAMLAVDAYTGSTQETVTSIDVTYEVASPRWNELRFDLETPAGKRVQIVVGGAFTGDRVDQASITAGQLLGGPAAGMWKLHVYDIQNNPGPGNDSTLKSARLTLHTTGGPDKIARTASWTSQVIDATSDVIAIDGITWNARIPDGASVQVRLRGCQQADCSDGPAYSGPVTSGVPFGIVPARYLQLRVELTSDGSHEPELQSLAIAFRRST
jgi:subtilisin-like proprotein convertase family protein